jgi:dTDP-4-dehydrorhamnose reductase
MNVLVLGASGMLGSAMLKVMSERNDWSVFGTLRKQNTKLQTLTPRAQFIPGIDALDSDSLINVFNQSRPQVVINCVGLIKQLATSEDPLETIPINSLFPHRLAKICELVQARLVHISTDCVFSGYKGNYLEKDFPDAQDLYGRSKLMGELYYSHAVTLRTSIIGHELGSENKSLIDWFLSQDVSVKGYVNAIFSGLPTCELAKVVRDYVIPNQNISGLYHVAAEPISKYDLLNLVKIKYGKNIQIDPDEKIKINRSLDQSKFKNATGYVAAPWPDLVSQMHDSR